jgi:DNA-binding SARP family transcriptional activator
VDVLHRLAAIHGAAGDYTAAILRAERLVALDRLERSQLSLLMRLHAANRDRASALRAYHQCMRVLRREMVVEPGLATKEIFERILRADSDPSSSATSRQPSPLQKNRIFVGRAAEWAQLTALWQAAIG